MPKLLPLDQALFSEQDLRGRPLVTQPVWRRHAHPGLWAWHGTIICSYYTIMRKMKEECAVTKKSPYWWVRETVRAGAPATGCRLKREIVRRLG